MAPPAGERGGGDVRCRPCRRASGVPVRSIAIPEGRSLAPVLHGLHLLCAKPTRFCRDSNTDRGQLWLGLHQREFSGMPA